MIAWLRRLRDRLLGRDRWVVVGDARRWFAYLKPGRRPHTVTTTELPDGWINLGHTTENPWAAPDTDVMAAVHTYGEPPWETLDKIRASLEPPCWCGRQHVPGYWHDPTYGRIDRDIQDWSHENFPDVSLATREVIESNAQRQKDEGRRP